jgi:hypothetical protein
MISLLLSPRTVGDSQEDVIDRSSDEAIKYGYCVSDFRLVTPDADGTGIARLPSQSFRRGRRVGSSRKKGKGTASVLAMPFLYSDLTLRT